MRARTSKKAVTPIISVIILLMITVVIAGLASVYLFGFMESKLQLIEVPPTGAFCANGNATVIIRNSGTIPISVLLDCGCPATGTECTCGELTIVKTSGGDSMDISFNKESIEAGGTAIMKDSACTDTVGCEYTIVSPSSRADANARCRS